MSRPKESRPSMYKDKRFLGVIPARGGSVGVPMKNIKPLGGVPLVVHTFRQAAQVPELDLVVLSTDNDEIAAVGAAHDVRVVRRPDELATGEAKTEGALLHALDALAGEETFDYVVVLEPTSPFRTPETIVACLKAIVDGNAPSLVTVAETRASIGRLVGGWFELLNPNVPRRRQEREPLYYESSTLYVCSIDHLRATGNLIADKWLGIIVDDRENFDINSPSDFEIAQILIEEGRINGCLKL